MSLIGSIYAAQSRQAQEKAAAEQRQRFEAYRAHGQRALLGMLHDPNWVGTAAPYGLINDAPKCNCRNCGAPFGFEEKVCSYCRSERI